MLHMLQAPVCLLGQEVTSQVGILKDGDGEWQVILMYIMVYFCRRLNLLLPASQPSKHCTLH